MIANSWTCTHTCSKDISTKKKKSVVSIKNNKDFVMCNSREKSSVSKLPVALDQSILPEEWQGRLEGKLQSVIVHAYLCICVYGRRTSEYVKKKNFES